VRYCQWALGAAFMTIAQQSEDNNQKTTIRRQQSEGNNQKATIRRQQSEDNNQKTTIRRQLSSIELTEAYVPSSTRRST
jgi:hypothetical protein